VDGGVASIDEKRFKGFELATAKAIALKNT
jgi:hypothetical protein